MGMQRGCRDGCRKSGGYRFFGTILRDYTRNTDAEPLHARLQRRPMHAEEGRGTVGAGNLPVCFIESGNDFPPFRVVERCLQIPTGSLANWRRISTKVE